MCSSIPIHVIRQVPLRWNSADSDRLAGEQVLQGSWSNIDSINLLLSRRNTLGRREFNRESRPSAQFTLHVHTGSVGFNDLLGGRQPQSRSSILAGIKILEHVDQCVRVHATTRID